MCRFSVERQRVVWIAAAAGVLACAGDAHGQTAAAQDPRLVRVDPGRQDTGPLAASSRVLPMDLRLPTDFEQVYQIQAKTGERSRTELFARRSGGLTAVFPRSQYLETRGGILAQVPAGTTYYLGRLPESVAGAGGVGERKWPANYVDNAARATRLDTSARVDERSLPVSADLSVAARTAAMENRVGGGGGGSDGREGLGSASGVVRGDDRRAEAMMTRPRRAPERPSVFSDEAYRTRTVHRLLDEAKEHPPEPREPAQGLGGESTGKVDASEPPAPVK
ncbi:MAG TPA: hypothetical protein VK176_12985 [Phycisphaerales bacterium]|nr:hypothetical protein [Phycisphaerales bacterium]